MNSFSSSASKARGSKAGRRNAKVRRLDPPTADRLERAALKYLERFSAPRVHLGRVLMRRVDRYLFQAAGERDIAGATVDANACREQAGQWIEEILERFERAGLVDDRAYARGRAGSLMRRGASLQKIRGTLREKGVAAALIGEIMDELRADVGDPELVAAIALARRRRLGPYARGDAKATPEERNRALGIMARAGFSYALASRILDIESLSEIDELLSASEYPVS